MNALEAVLELVPGLKICVREYTSGGAMHWDVDPSTGQFTAAHAGMFAGLVIKYGGKNVYRDTATKRCLVAGDTLTYQPEGLADIIYTLIDEGSFLADA